MVFLCRKNEYPGEESRNCSADSEKDGGGKRIHLPFLQLNTFPVYVHIHVFVVKKNLLYIAVSSPLDRSKRFTFIP